MNPVNLELSAHWYDKDGMPVYEVPMKTKPGQMRPTTVKDAREMQLLPSITTVDKIVFNQVLQTWIINQYVNAALDMQAVIGESTEDFAKRVVLEGRSESRRAATFGERMHDLIEKTVSGEVAYPETMQEMFVLDGAMKFLETMQLETWLTECGVAYPHWGYGGRLDWLGLMQGQVCLVDWKTQKTSPKKPISFYPDWNMQLSALGKACEHMKYVTAGEYYKVSVVVSSTEPGRVQSFVWMDKDEDWGWRCFRNALSLYYSPVGPGATLVYPGWVKES